MPQGATPRVAADLRMLESSGIGRYLQQVVPRLAGGARAEWLLLGDAERLARHGLGPRPGVATAAAHAPIYSLAEQLELARAAPPEVDLFWSPHYNVPLLRRGRLLVTVHDVLHLARPEFVGGPHRRWYARAMFAALRRRADRVICVSRFGADELARWAGVDPARITVVHQGVDAAWFEPADDDRPHARPYLLFVGNVKPHKNLGRLVEAFASLVDRIPHDLVVVGRTEGFRTGDRAALAGAAAVGQRIHLAGEVDDAALRSLVRHADALVFPSLYEGFGLPPLEAMASGCPALVSRAASLPEVCGDAALYFDALDPRDIAARILEVTGSAELREELRGRGLERARRFSWERCAAETGEVIDALLAG